MILWIIIKLSVYSYIHQEQKNDILLRSIVIRQLVKSIEINELLKLLFIINICILHQQYIYYLLQ